ncbi:MAG: hypothetical protein QOF71_494 [Candidatus Eremiobacteraeota bacterium]|jgi:hypothetical protein|nr:hypothetical protein [Candidatus Eremiobacteraeota bacterium]
MSMSKAQFLKFIETNGKDLTVDSLQSAKARIDRIVERKVSAINVLEVKEGDRVLVLGASILEAGDNAPAIIGELKETGVRVLLPGEEYLLGRFGYDRLKRLSDEEYVAEVLAYAERKIAYAERKLTEADSKT